MAEPSEVSRTSGGVNAGQADAFRSRLAKQEGDLSSKYGAAYTTLRDAVQHWTQSATQIRAAAAALVAGKGVRAARQAALDNPATFQGKALPADEQAVEHARSFLRTLASSPSTAPALYRAESVPGARAAVLAQLQAQVGKTMTMDLRSWSSHAAVGESWARSRSGATKVMFV